MAELLAQGDATNLATGLAAADGLLGEGDLAELRVEFRLGVPDWLAGQLGSWLRGQPAQDYVIDGVWSEGGTLVVRGRKGTPWLALVAAFLAGAALVALIVLWRVLRLDPLDLVGGAGTILLIAGAVLALVLLSGGGD